MGSIKRSVGISSLFFIAITTSLHAFELPRIPGDLIYGNDDRIEINDYKNEEIVKMSNSVALKVSKRRLTVDRNDPDRILFPFIALKNSMKKPLCPDERFADQVALGTCSGFLVSPTTLVTAGHCVVDKEDCNDGRWVFGYKEGVTELTSSQVYSCKSITSQRYVYDKNEVSDYAVIELDRPVTGYVPLKTRKFGRVLLKTPLVVVGHPLGLPMKAIGGGVVSRMNTKERQNPIRSFLNRSHYFTANLDTYIGSSGSPVFNRKNGQVEGILIRGAEDFVFNEEKECMESNKITESPFEAYEKVMRINKVPGL